MLTIISGLLMLLSGLPGHARSADHGPQSQRQQQDLGDPTWDLSDVDASCTVSHATRYDMTRARGQRAVSFATAPSSHADVMQPAIAPMNATAGEQWEFDGVSEDGTQAFIFGFYRDPNYSFLGTGNLRAYAELVVADPAGRQQQHHHHRHAVVDYAEESTVVTCPDGGTRGVWRGDGFAYAFAVAADMATATVDMRTAEATVRVSLAAVAPPRFPDGTTWSSSSSTRTSSLTVPHFHWVEPMPAADATVTGVVDGREVSWRGVGGHERLWGAFNWRACLDDLVIVRFRAGGFALSFWDFGSARRKGVSFPSLALFEHGRTVFFGGGRQERRRQDDDDASRDQDSFTFRKLYGDECNGTTTSNLKDRATGVELVLRSPLRGLQWRFVVTFTNVAFEYVLTRGMGGTGYSGTVVGGLDADAAPQSQGPAFVEIMKFPERWWLLPDNYRE